MYAFAFFDKSAHRLLLARDPIGIKPLYWTPELTPFVFASEIGGIMASGVVAHSIDAAGMASLLAYGALQEPLTIYRDVKSLPRRQLGRNSTARPPGSHDIGAPPPLAISAAALMPIGDASCHHRHTPPGGSRKPR